MPDFDRIWDETFPPDTQPANQLGLDLRQLKTDIRERVTLSGNDAAKPTNPQALEVGLIYIAVDTGKFWRWNGTVWVDITGSFVSNANVLHSLGATLPFTVPANYLIVGSLIQLDVFVVFNSGIIGGGNYQIGGVDFAPHPTSAGPFPDTHWTRTLLYITAVGISGTFSSFYSGRTTNSGGSVDVVGSFFGAINTTIDNQITTPLFGAVARVFK